MDEIIVDNLVVRNIIGVDSWERHKRQPVHISITVYCNVNDAGSEDLLSKSTNYGTLCKAVTVFSETSAYKSVEALATGISRMCFETFPISRIKVRVEKTKALLRAESAGVEIIRSKENDFTDDYIFIKNLQAVTIIGVNAWERDEKQKVLVSIKVFPMIDFESMGDHVSSLHNYRTIARLVSEHVDASCYKTVEALAASIAQLCVTKCHVQKIGVRVEKPSALLFAKCAGVEITRVASDFCVKNELDPSQTAPLPTQSSSTSASLFCSNPPPWHIAFIALGSNKGDRVGNVARAVEQLRLAAGCNLLDTSFLYETDAQYVVEQAKFVNGACMISTLLSPSALLSLLKEIESTLGRQPTFHHGPREIDLDLLFYDDLQLESPNLSIPHPLLQERDFVLVPLMDIAPTLRHPRNNKTIHELLLSLSSKIPSSANVDVAAPISPPTIQPGESALSIRRMMLPTLDHYFVPSTTATCQSHTLATPKTRIMGIVNVTPDSFSDGGLFFNEENAIRHALDLIAQGADLIDIGGQSTRPNAVLVDESEEIRRVVGVIGALKQKHKIRVPISIDTFRAKVALEAVRAGADMINDVSGARRDPEMLAVMAQTRVAVCLMHMRGDAATMMSMTDYGGEGCKGNVVASVVDELRDTVSRALSCGVCRWQIIVDPGIGFAKTGQQNLELLRQMRAFTDVSRPSSAHMHLHPDTRDILPRPQLLLSYPVLAGPSRKSFLGDISRDVDAHDRLMGTVAACVVCVAGGATILRVHDVEEVRKAVLVADAIYRNA